MRVFALRDHEVMILMMRAERHDPDKTETVELCQTPGVRNRHGHRRSVRETDG